jgi:hypothetical protein
MPKHFHVSIVDGPVVEPSQRYNTASDVKRALTKLPINITDDVIRVVRGDSVFGHQINGEVGVLVIACEQSTLSDCSGEVADYLLGFKGR